MDTNTFKPPSFPYDAQFVRDTLIKRNGTLTEEEKTNITKNIAESDKRLINQT